MVGVVSVIRRNGERAALDIQRIKSVISWACDGLDVSALELEVALTTRLEDGVSTKNIQDNLIHQALELCDLESPDWRYVAGRLHIWNLWKDVFVKRGSKYEEFAKNVQIKVENQRYDSRLLQHYSLEELEEAGNWINSDWDKDYDYAGATLLTRRYLQEDELPQEAFLVCALLLALPETEEKRLSWARNFYLAIASRKISLATPILANLRVPNASLASCFINMMDDSLESILATLTDVGLISRKGGGVGTNLSRVRAIGSWVAGREKASGGVAPWIKLLNDMAIAVNQGGKRAGAITVSLDVWHLDIPEFLEIQAEHGDPRRKSHAVFPQIVISDEFMRRVENDEDWTLVDPYEVRQKLGVELAELWGEVFEVAYRLVEFHSDLRLTKKVKAKDLFKEIMRTQIETGLPYLWFKDAANRANPNQHHGYIPCGNLCQESFSNVKAGEEAHTCNLVSLNLANIDFEEIEFFSRLAVRLLDNTIDLSVPPISSSSHHNQLYRTIGVGVMGLADFLAKIRYSYRDRAALSRIFEEIGYHCTAASMELAKDRGAYPAFPGSSWSKGLLTGAKPVEWFEQNARDPKRWVSLSQDIQTYGIRNSHINAIAPNTSSSLVQGCTAGVLPCYSHFFYDKAKGSVPVMPPFIKDSVWFYSQNKTLDQTVVVEAIAEIQQWIDTGISMELLFNLNQDVYELGKTLSAEDIYNILMLAWRRGLKSIYYVRTVQKDSYNEDCFVCSN
jgi:ribonucleoside-diphosphate reductase alpha chain